MDVPGPFAVRAAGLRKRFRKFTAKGDYTTLKTSLLARLLGISRPPVRYVQILDGIDLEVPRGRVLGIIGRNGSGKSTLLKLIAGILKPDSGKVEVEGRISPLIELGAGFHPEFSGRENIHLNGIVLGMTRADIEERYDSIVDFAELRDSIDDPVRTYSSGMYMRLGFSIAVHASPDILLIDEILAVGDQSFQRKCEQWLSDFLRRGKTVVLVSHEISAVERWCHEVIWLDQGRIRMRGSPREVLVPYQEDLEPEVGGAVPGSTAPVRDAVLRIDRVRTLDDAGSPRAQFPNGAPLAVEIDCERPGGDVPFALVLRIRRADGIPCFSARTADVPEGSSTLHCRFGPLPLSTGAYVADVVVERSDGVILVERLAAALFTVESPLSGAEIFELDHDWTASPRDAPWTSRAVRA